jgi:CO/xanthine dehydrogenase Mo-binding subunit
VVRETKVGTPDRSRYRPKFEGELGSREKVDLDVIGKRQPRLDSPEKVSGRSLFADDVVLPGMLCGKVLRSRYAHARIKSIDTSKAEALPGVKAVLTAKDVGEIDVNGREPVFAKEWVTYIGEEVAAVAALDEKTAEAALALIEVDYEELPAVMTMRRALKEGAPLVNGVTEGNVWSDDVDNYGDPDAAFEAADYVFEEKYEAGVTHNLFAEFHVAVVDFSLPDKLTLYTPTQTSYLMQHALGPAFGLSISQVQIIHLNTGGAFSGRGSVRPHHYIAALLSRQTRRPVKVFATGDEEFLVCRALGENKYKMRMALAKDGTIKAFDMAAEMDGGAVGTEVGYFGWMAGLCNSWVFPLEGLRMRRRCVLTNNRPNFLGHGGLMLSTNAAIMQLINTAAKKMGRDPMDLLYQNAIEEGHVGLSGEWFASCGLKECIETVRKASDWDKRYGKLEPYHGLGVGIGSMAAGAKGAFRHDTSAVMVRVNEDGLCTVYTGIPDMGQGTHTTMAMIAAEVLGIDPEDMQVIAGDTDLTPVDVGAFAQRGTIQTGNAARNAALDARDQLAKVAAAKLEVEQDSLVFQGGKVYPEGAPDNAIAFEKLVYATLHGKEGRSVMGRGFYNSPLQFGTTSWSFGAQVCEVKVDPDTGEVEVIKVWVAHDLGRAINPLACEGQIDGQVYSAMSQILYEEVQTDAGLYLNPSRLEYKMPRTYEMPEIEYHLIETIDPFGPFGAKEIGEGIIVVSGGAIAAAVSDALGGEFMGEMPMAPWRVLKHVKKQQRAAAKTAA